jgi:DNA-binding NtrC family response regulator
MSDHSRVKVLIVDDEPSIRESLVEFLLDEGFEVSDAGSGEEALEKVKKNSFDVAVVDMRLPGMTGDTLIFKIHDIQPAMRFLVCTGTVDFSISAELEKVGIFPKHILKKPLFDLYLLVHAIEELTAAP